MGNRNASTSGVSSFNSSPSRIQRPSSASSLRSSSRYRSDRGRSSSSLSNDSYPLSTLNKLHGSGDASPLINKLRAKVASRMMGFKNGSNQGSSSDYDSMSCNPTTAHRHSTSGPGSLTNSNGNGVTNGTGFHGSTDINSGSTGDASGGDSMFPKLKSQSSLTNDQLTAHLTEEERLILQKVFQKEEEFHREALSKRQFKTSTVDKKDGPTLSSSPTQSPSSGSQLVGNCRTCRKKILTNEPCNYCDTCSEPICEDCSSYSDKSKEKLWMCSFCRRRGTQPAVAALTELGLMIPSSLVTGRRRSTIVNMKDSFQQQRRPSSIETGRSTPSEVPNRSDALPRLQTPNSLGARYEGRNLVIPGNLPNRRYSSIVVTKERYSSNEGLNERRTSDELKSSTLGENLVRKETTMYRSRDELRSMSANESHLFGRSTSPGVSITSENHRVLGKSFSASDSSLEDYPMDSASKSTHGSTLESGELSVLKRRRSQRSRSVHQSNRLMGSDDAYDNSIQSTSLHGNNSNHLSTHLTHQQQAQQLTSNASTLGTTNPILRTSYGALNGPDFWDSSDANKGAKRINKNTTNGMANAFNLPIVYNENNVNVNNLINSNMNNNLRHIASDVALYSPQSDNRRKSDSQSSEYSDIRIPSPPQESMSPSSPDYSRSPRESADSDMLGLPTIGPLPTQRRSIPSVLVDNAVDTHHLTLKDCFPRRSSTGRALPRIPSEQSRSLLELPQGRTQSTHSLDLPNPDQPRRASAPEGENITIVIDDVDSAGVRKSNSQIERIILHRDENDVNPRTHGFGLVVMGGKISETDGKLYAYVAYVVPGGSADKMSLKAGDKILEWDRKSLVNCTFEQVCSIIESSQNTAELLIEPYNRTERRGALIHQRRRLSQAFSQSGSDIYASPPISPSYQGANRSGRKLPRTPESVQPVGQGEILIQTWVDLERSELVITIICAKGLNNKKPCFARVRIIPEMGFKCCQTELSNGLEWNETVIIQKFPIEKITEMALEIGIWETIGDKAELLGETVIPMESAIAHNTDWWPLLLPQYLFNLARSSSLDTLAVKSLTDGFPCLSESRSVPSSRRNSGRSDIIDPLRVINNLNTSASHLHSSSSNVSPSRSMSLRIARPSSETLVHHGPMPGPTSANQLVAGSGGMGTPPPSLTVEPPPLSPRRKSASCIASSKMNRSFSLKSNPDTSASGGENIRVDSSASSNYHQSVTTNSDSDSEAITSESDSVNTSTISQMGCDLGSDLIVGEIKLGFVMTKGLLEIEVIAARGLPTTHSKQPPDTYVKTYLKESNRHTNKKKTRVVYGSCDPQYRQTLKYDAALIYGRSLLVMVWQKHKGFEHNTPLGAVDVKVNSLELHKLTISWFKLYALNHSS